MTDHSPDHAERAAAVATWTKVGGAALLNGEPPSMEIIYRAMLAYADERVAAALRGRDVVGEALREHLSEQITHVEARIKDGQEMGAAVWRIALEDVVRENRAALGDRP